MQKVVFISIPQCGTHLLLRYLALAGFRHAGPYGQIRYTEDMPRFIDRLEPGDYTAWHYRWTPETSPIARMASAHVIMLYRDPRAQACSLMHFIRRTPAHPAHSFLETRLNSDRERMLRLIQGYFDVDFDEFEPPGLPADPFCHEHGKGPISTRRGGLNNVYRYYARWRYEPCVLYCTIGGHRRLARPRQQGKGTRNPA